MLVATCHIPDCGNADVPIALDFIDPAAPPTNVICGPCGHPITDLAADGVVDR